MSEPSEAAKLRRLPGGSPQQALIIKRALSEVVLRPAGGDWAGLEAGALVEIETASTLLLGEVIRRDAESLLTVSVEHFVDQAALAEIEEAGKTSGA